MGYTENINSILKWGNAFQRQFGIPLDRSSLHTSYDDAYAYAKGDGSDERGLGKEAYIGQIITVWGLNEKNKEGVWVYSLVPHTPSDETDTRLADLKPVGSATTETATNYSAAKALSLGLAVGQLIQVSEAEEVEETVEGATVKNTYQAGFYIVNAPGSISALGTSSGADDEIGALETRVSALEGNKVAKTDFETYQGTVETALAGKVDNSYKQEVTDSLAGKVDNSALETYQGQVTELLNGKVDNSYKQEVTDALATKATVDALTTLEGRVDTDIQNLTTLTGRVDEDIQNLTTHLTDYSGKLGEVDGRLAELESFVESHESIEESDIEGLFTPKTNE